MRRRTGDIMARAEEMGTGQAVDPRPDDGDAHESVRSSVVGVRRWVPNLVIRGPCSRPGQFITKLALVFTPPDTAPTRRAETHAERGAGDPQPGPLARALDRLLEATIVGSFSRVWLDGPPGDTALAAAAASGRAGGRRDRRFIRHRPGRRVLALGSLGAEVWVVGRDRDRTEAVAGAIRSAGGRAEAALLDVADGAAVDAFADRFAATTRPARRARPQRRGSPRWTTRSRPRVSN